MSRPCRFAIEQKVEDPILDYGCGRGDDVEALRKVGREAYGWDPHFDQFRLQGRKIADGFPTILCTYVLNTVPLEERVRIVRMIYDMLRPGGRALISVRSSVEKIPGEKYQDGVQTVRGTFQKTFDGPALAEFLQEVLGIGCGARIKILMRRPWVTVEIAKPASKR